MIHITAEAELRAKLCGLEGPAEIRDEHGEVIGYFTPAGRNEQELYQRAAANFDCDEKNRRKETSEKGLTTQDVVKHLESLENS